jgi:hypothetical protein
MNINDHGVIRTHNTRKSESGRRPSPYTARPLGSAVENIHGTKYFLQDVKLVYLVIHSPCVATEIVLHFSFQGTRSVLSQMNPAHMLILRFL